MSERSAAEEARTRLASFIAEFLNCGGEHNEDRRIGIDAELGGSRMQHSLADAVLGYCDFHDEDMLVSYVEYGKHGKCIGCRYFVLSDDFHSVCEASLKLSVSEGTVRRWLKSRKLSGVMIINVWPVDFPNGRVNKKWFVTDDSIAQLKK